MILKKIIKRKRSSYFLKKKLPKRYGNFSPSSYFYKSYCVGSIL